MDLAVLALAFGAIFVVELPDKTFLATLVLTTRYRPLAVWLGVGAAFGVQTLIAVGLGKVASLLPPDVVHIGAALMFLVGGLWLLREARSHAAAVDSEVDADPAKARGFWGSAVASFLVLFAAEWGDLSQLLTLTLVARYDDPLSVGLGAWAALLTVSGLAVLAGRLLASRIPIHTLHYVGAAVCFTLAALTTYDVIS